MRDCENFADHHFQLYSAGCMQPLQWDNEVKSIQPRPGAETELQGLESRPNNKYFKIKKFIPSCYIDA